MSLHRWDGELRELERFASAVEQDLFAKQRQVVVDALTLTGGGQHTVLDVSRATSCEQGAPPAALVEQACVIIGVDPATIILRRGPSAGACFAACRAPVRYSSTSPESEAQPPPEAAKDSRRTDPSVDAARAAYESLRFSVDDEQRRAALANWARAWEDRKSALMRERVEVESKVEALNGEAENSSSLMALRRGKDETTAVKRALLFWRLRKRLSVASATTSLLNLRSSRPAQLGGLLGKTVTERLRAAVDDKRLKRRQLRRRLRFEKGFRVFLERADQVPADNAARKALREEFVRKRRADELACSPFVRMLGERRSLLRPGLPSDSALQAHRSYPKCCRLMLQQLQQQHTT